MQQKLLETHGELRVQGERAVAVEAARAQAVTACGRLEGELKTVKDSLARSEAELAQQTGALMSERAAVRKLRSEAEAERQRAQHKMEVVERSCADLRAWAQASEEKVLSLTVKLEQCQQRVTV